MSYRRPQYGHLPARSYTDILDEYENMRSRGVNRVSRDQLEEAFTRVLTIAGKYRSQTIGLEKKMEYTSKERDQYQKDLQRIKIEKEVLENTEKFLMSKLLNEEEETEVENLMREQIEKEALMKNLNYIRERLTNTQIELEKLKTSAPIKQRQRSQTWKQQPICPPGIPLTPQTIDRYSPEVKETTNSYYTLFPSGLQNMDFSFLNDDKN